MSDNDSSAEDPFGQIADEFLEAFRQGKRPSVEEFARRYPTHAEEIRDMLPALLLMEKAKTTDESPGPQSPARTAASAPQLSQLGEYQILREVGRGGMGVVYEAQQLSLGRHVAIKVLPSHALLDPRHLRRFQREARSAAKLHHTNIVPVFGVGEHDGLHYYVMQFIQGLGLDVVLNELRRLRQPHGKRTPTRDDAVGRPTHGSRVLSAADVAHSLLTGEFRQPEPAGNVTPATVEPAAPVLVAVPASAPAADTSATIHLPGQTEASTLNESSHQYWQSVARVGVQVADALVHAASQGVLHRDIKPSNLLLDDTGNVWVTDFGLAKMHSDGDDLTNTGDIVGTLRYMAPERFNGQGDQRSDIYSLGLTLYELLALRPAFDEADKMALVDKVMHDEPVRPRKVNPSVPRDLETVVLKAIARDPAHRYQTPAELADDLKRFVEDRPVKARRVSETEKFLRWCRRNPLPASLLAGIVLVFLAGFVGVFWQWRVAETARAEEKDQRRQADALRKGAETARDEAVAARDEAKHTRNDAARQAAGLLLDRGIEDARGGEPVRALHLFVQALRALPPDDTQATPLERVIRANLTAWAETVPALEHIWPGSFLSTDVAFTPDGARIAMATGTDEIQCFRTDTGRAAGPPVKIPDGVGQAMVFAPDGQSLWVTSPGPPKRVDRWALHRLDPASGRPLQPPIPTVGWLSALVVTPLAVTPNGRYLVGAVIGLHPEDRGPRLDADETRQWRTTSIFVWEAATGRVVRKVDVNAELPYALMGLAPDGTSVTAWVPRGANTLEGVTFTVDGKEPPKSLGPHPLAPWAESTLLFQNNLRTALGIKDGQFHRWSVTNPGVLGPGIPSPFPKLRERPSPDGRSAISVGEGRVFDTGAWPPRPSGVHFAHSQWLDTYYSKEQYSPDGRFLVTWPLLEGNDRRLWRLPRPPGRPPLPRPQVAEGTRPPERKDYYGSARFDPFTGSVILWELPQDKDSPLVRIVDVATGSVRTPAVRHWERVREVAFTPDGRYFATASFDTTARVWETATGRPAGPPLTHTNFISTVGFSPDGNTLAAGDFGPNGLVKLWDWRTGKEVRPPLQHDDIVLKVSFSPDGRFIAVLKAPDWSKKPELLIWDVASATTVVRVPHTNKGIVHKLEARFRPDSRAVAARDADGVLRLWEVPSGNLLGTLPLDGGWVTRFAPEGRLVAAAVNLGVRLLDADTLAPLPGGFLPHPDPVLDLAFSPDGAFLLSGHESGSAQLWDVATRKPVGPPVVLLGPIRAVHFSPDGKTCVCVAADGTVRRWPVPTPFDEPDLARLADRVALLTGQKMDDSHGLDYIPAEKWRDLRAKLVGEGSTALVAPRPDADWHDRVAADAEQDGDAFGAEWHLDRLAVLRPDDWTVPARKGRILAAAGRWEEAAAAYAAARRLAPSPQVLADWLRAAAATEEVAGRNEAGLWNLDRAVELTPQDWVPYAARSALADQAGHADRARADVDEAFRLGADAFVIAQMADRLASRATQKADWARVATLLAASVKELRKSIGECHHLAIARVQVGDRAGYRAACAAIAAQMPPPGTPLELGEALDASRAFAVGPGATDEWAIPLSWVDWVLDHMAQRQAALKKPNNQMMHLFLLPRGALLYRAGRHPEATEVLRKATSLHALGGDFFDWGYLALAEHALGHEDAAKQAALKARALKPSARSDTAWDRAEVELLAAEMDAALPPGK